MKKTNRSRKFTAKNKQLQGRVKAMHARVRSSVKRNQAKRDAR